MDRPAAGALDPRVIVTSVLLLRALGQKVIVFGSVLCCVTAKLAAGVQ